MVAEEETSTPGPSMDPSDSDGEEVSQDDHSGGDYTTRLEELLSDADNTSPSHTDNDEEEEGFFYTGVDAGPAPTYKEQLRDVLGPDHEEDEQDEVEVEHSLFREVAENEAFATAMDDEAPVSLILHPFCQLNQLIDCKLAPRCYFRTFWCGFPIVNV